MERESERDGEREREFVRVCEGAVLATLRSPSGFACVYARERESERERERESEREREKGRENEKERESVSACVCEGAVLAM